MSKPETWILVADAARARVVRNPDRSPKMHQAPLETVLEASAEPQPLREVMADRPGRSFASIGARRSAMEYRSEPARDATRHFATSLLSALEVRLAAGDFDQLVICAPPRMLNALRETMPGALAAVVVSQVAKDFTKLAELELRHRIQDLTGVPD